MHRAALAFAGAAVFVAMIACEGGSSTTDQGTSGGSSSEAGTPSGTPVDIRASSYDTTCAADADCVAVYEGSACEPCGCKNAAINVKDRDRFYDDRAKAREGCPKSTVQCDECPTPPVACDPATKRCSVRRADAG